MLDPRLREFLLHGAGYGRTDLTRYGGPAVVWAAWHRHKAELIAECPPGKGPHVYRVYDRRLQARPPESSIPLFWTAE